MSKHEFRELQKRFSDAEQLVVALRSGQACVIPEHDKASLQHTANVLRSARESLQKDVDLQTSVLETRTAERTNEFECSKEYLDTILFNLPVGVAVLEGDNFIYSIINKYLADINGLPVEAHIGKPIAEVLPHLADSIIPNLKKVLATGVGIPKREIQINSPDGKTRWLMDFHFPLGKQAIIAVVVDITKRKQSELDLIDAKYKAELANNAKTEFIGRMSHELRTPLNSILGFGQLLQRDNNNFNQNQNENIQRILEGGQHLLHLINDVLDISKIDAGEMDVSLETVAIKRVVNNSLLLVNQLASKFDVKINPLPERICSVKADQQRLKQVLINLISNAIKYNRHGGKVSIDYHVIDAPNFNKTPPTVRISVTDTGMGIKKEDYSRVFEPFQRITVHGANIDGIGIGLTISKKLMEVMGGQIGLDSTYGKGTTFWVELPFADDNEQNQIVEDSPSFAVQASGLEAKKILYIEDNTANLILMQQIINIYPSYELLCATTAKAGIDIAKEQKPDVILMDIDLPDMNGFQALEHLQATEQTSHIPVIAVSAHALLEQVEKGKNLSFVDYLTKPFDIDKLINLINDQLADSKV